jgi:hypothetical protein
MMANAGHAFWRRKILRKKIRGNSTPGTSKPNGCKASSVDKYMTKSSRSKPPV